jgi:transcriptional regulator with XRE-family HTH domain
MNSRISLLLRAKNITPAQLADDIGVQRSGISHILNGRNKPSLDFIQRIIKKYPDISMNWLIFGDGPMMNPYPSVQVPDQEDKPSIKPTIMELFSEEIKEDEIYDTPEEVNNQGNGGYYVDNKVNNLSQEAIPKTEQKNIYPQKEEEQTKIEPEKIEKPLNETTHRGKGKKISRIVIFYHDKTFTEYFPDED